MSVGNLKGGEGASRYPSGRMIDYRLSYSLGIGRL